VARPMSDRSTIAYWLMDSIVYDLEALNAVRNGDSGKEVRCILLAITAKKLALGRIEGLSGSTPKPSGSRGG